MQTSRETRRLTVTVEGEARDATWKQGVGIYVSGHDIGKGDTLEIKDETLTTTVSHWLGPLPRN